MIRSWLFWFLHDWSDLELATLLLSTFKLNEVFKFYASITKRLNFWSSTVWAERELFQFQIVFLQLCVQFCWDPRIQAHGEYTTLYKFSLIYYLFTTASLVTVWQESGRETLCLSYLFSFLGRSRYPPIPLTYAATQSLIYVFLVLQIFQSPVDDRPTFLHTKSIDDAMVLC